MKYNPIPPFIFREAGFLVNDVPRIQCQTATKDSHTIISEDGDLRIPFRLHGVFSYFLLSNQMRTIFILVLQMGIIF